MIAAIKEAVVAYLQTEAVSGGLLEGVNKVVSGPVVDLPDCVYPFISVYCDPVNVNMPLGVADPPIELEGILQVELYTQSGKCPGEAENACLRLVLSDDGENGLLRALNAKFRYLVGEIVVVVIPSQEIQFRAGEKSTDPFTYAARVRLQYKTKI